MTAIYRPKGRALEYSFLALNLYRGCSHHCRYCFVPGSMRMSREVWQALPVQPRTDIIKQLRRDAPQFAGTDERVLLCFTSDPYSPEAKASGVTRQALEILREHDIPWQLLTKGGTRAVDDFDLYGPNDAFATTMTFTNSDNSVRMEPGAAWPYDRQDAIRRARSLGIETWVSLEPVIDPNQSLGIIRVAHEEVCLFKIGKLNHDRERERQIDWSRFGREAVNLCEKYGTPYYVKEDLAAHLRGDGFTDFRNTDTRKVTRCAMTDGTCQYVNRPCEFWEPQDPDAPAGPGECVAVDPEQCPNNAIADLAAIEEWRRRQVAPNDNE